MEAALLIMRLLIEPYGIEIRKGEITIERNTTF